jgi:hypothetical protein
MTDFIIHIDGFKRTFKVFQIGTNVNPYDRDSLHNYLLRNYANYSILMHHRIRLDNYSVKKPQT